MSNILEVDNFVTCRVECPKCKQLIDTTLPLGCYEEDNEKFFIRSKMIDCPHCDTKLDITPICYRLAVSNCEVKEVIISEPAFRQGDIVVDKLPPFNVYRVDSFIYVCDRDSPPKLCRVYNLIPLINRGIMYIQVVDSDFVKPPKGSKYYKAENYMLITSDKEGEEVK